MTEDEFQQEWYNSFEAAIKGAVYLQQLGKAREDKRISNVPYDDKVLVHTVWDLGIGKGDAMAVGFYQKVGAELRKIDYYENTGLGLKHYIKFVKDKTYIYGKHFAPHDIKHKELTTGKSRLETARGLGIDFEVVPSISVEDGIDLARSAFNRLWVDKTKCELWVDLIGQYHFETDEKRGVFTKRPVHDFTSHAADEFRYAAIVEDQMNSEAEVIDTPRRQPPVNDEYVGDVDIEWDQPDGMGKHPVFRGIDIGKMGHRKD
jgi:hypothetical protein